MAIFSAVKKEFLIQLPNSKVGLAFVQEKCYYRKVVKKIQMY
ncbi:hypothetical protein SD77_2165 [Bacillus badius]|uniref:Ribose 5-phosphate isomerase B n=1 Tax=Bacillus badius TaxID=1455 RepID=A0ABR5AZD3_BACBA|nr:hypothetical protein SD78_2370 [Bacillus badius]KIL79711.1 hypothetical protein SD77_2165 [Bacillus badius]